MDCPFILKNNHLVFAMCIVKFQNTKPCTVPFLQSPKFHLPNGAEEIFLAGKAEVKELLSVLQVHGPRSVWKQEKEIKNDLQRSLRRV